ncbi:hypothetical protein EBT31_15795 [bacterium]|nr:hypothetical protein [bacterium]
MPASNDPQRRPLYIDRVNKRLLSDPLGAGAWPVEVLPAGAFSTAGSNVVIGRYGASGAAQELTADVTIQLLNTATTEVIAAVRVAAGSTSAPGVLQLTDSTSSTSTTTAATPNSVKTAWDLANAALPKAGGAMGGLITFAAGQTITGYGAIDAAQTWTRGQRAEVTLLTDAASITINLDDSNNFAVTLAGNRVLNNPSNITPGQSGSIFIAQDATGSRLLSYESAWDFAGGAVPSLSTAANAVDRLDYIVRNSTSIHAVLTKAVA